MKSLSNYLDMLVAQGEIGPGDRQKIYEQIIESIVDTIEIMPSFNQKSAYDMGARDMRFAIIREIQGLVKK